MPPAGGTTGLSLSRSPEKQMAIPQDGLMLVHSGSSTWARSSNPRMNSSTEVQLYQCIGSAAAPQPDPTTVAGFAARWLLISLRT